MIISFRRFTCHLRVAAWRRILDLLNETCHVFEEEVVHVLLVHLPQFQEPPLIFL